MAAALADIAWRIAVLIAILTIIAAPLMKYFARQIPLLRCALIFFVPSFAVCLIIMTGWLLLRVGGVAFPNELSGVTVFAGMFAVGWLINRYVARTYGIPTKFPSLGFKVMLGTLAGLWLLVGVGYVIWYMPA